MKVMTSIVTDATGRSWPLVQIGPVENKQEAQAILTRMSELITAELGAWTDGPT